VRVTSAKGADPNEALTYLRARRHGDHDGAVMVVVTADLGQPLTALLRGCSTSIASLASRRAPDRSRMPCLRIISRNSREGICAILCYSVDTMSNQVGIRDLRQHASAFLKRVSRGETIEVTDHGHPVARIVPVRPGVLDQLIQDGRASEAEGDLLDLADKMGLPADGPPPSAALAELRSDER
jgi:prevent-host-death family protein